MMSTIDLKKLEASRYRKQLRWVWLPICLLVLWVAVAHGYGLDKTADKSVFISPEAQQKIRSAFQSEENARLVYVAAQALRQAATSEAQAQVKCWPCHLTQLADGQLVFVSDAPSPTPTPTPKEK